ncbi:nuclear transport factor 2 family protein [Aquimarina litoralis]|uniref:nuclear transport factor 2 family protein n=1 Tax=Aquimarina litoralis TaxID=584605 RepID=UPI001C593C3A|nr:nuclear transport factor 2 family protein [Aquimarina litoralis]MBW1294063.1 hypothetical protein [Aquimarina litoralis]
MDNSSKTITKLLLAFSLISSMLSFSQHSMYYRHLRYNHVSPYIELKGIHQIDSITANKTSHYVFRFDKSNRLTEIINNHYHTEKTHPLASLGVYKVVINYTDGKEIRTFFNPNNDRITNHRNVYKEVFLLDKNGLRKQLNFYDLKDKPMESNWEITEYRWEPSKKYIIERRYNLAGKLVDLSPYFEFGITGIVLDKTGCPKEHYNLNSKLEVEDNHFGIASYKDFYDEIGNHIKYSYHSKDKNFVMNEWGYSIGIKEYDTIGNHTKLRLLNTKKKVISTRKIYSNATVKLSRIATTNDSLEIQKRSLGYLIALQKLRPQLMDSVLNDRLNKITVGYDHDIKKQFAKKTTKDQMIDFAESWNASGSKFPFNPTNQIKILDIYNRIATVKLTSDNWVEYLQLIKLNDHWEIVNLLWQYKDVKMYGE